MIVISYPVIVGAVLRAQRKNKRLSQTEVGAKVGVSASVYSRIEYGKSGCALTQLRRAAEALGIAPSLVLLCAENILLPDGQEVEYRILYRMAGRALQVRGH
jgi:transcriptional regulator with XRE-family HTH domain